MNRSIGVEATEALFAVRGILVSKKAGDGAKGDAPITPKNLERLTRSVRVAEVVKGFDRFGATRPSVTYGKIRERGDAGDRITSAP